MKALKVILYIILGLVLLFILLNVLGPKTLETTRTTSINASPNVIHNQINNLQNWQNWSPWSMADTTMKITYGDKSAGIGANYTWTSENQGNGTMEIVESSATGMKTKMKFEGFDGNSYGTFDLTEGDDGATDVSWGMSSDANLPFIMRGMMLVFGAKKTLEGQFDEGLANIKKLAEADAEAIKSATVNTADAEDAHYVVHREKIPFDNITQFYTENYGGIGEELGKVGAQMAGMPVGIYYDWDVYNGMTDIGAAIPVAGPVEVENYEMVTIPAGKTVYVDHYGPYSSVGPAHWAIDQYMNSNGLELKGPIVEAYMNDPTTVTEDKIHTRVTYYVN